jgi:predicted DsbA family dithiol-disulfide isomerase
VHAVLTATVWSDYICPWCYLGRDRSALIESLGVPVTAMPYELHPELPAAGRAVKQGGRLAAVHDDIARQCAAVGLAFEPPTHIPNSRRALETAEVVRDRDPDAFTRLDAALFDAHFVRGLDIGDGDVLDDLVAAAGAPAPAVRAAVDQGAGRAAVAASMDDAHNHGVAGTPAWLFGDLVIPGAQPRELFERVVTRLRAQASAG